MVHRILLEWVYVKLNFWIYTRKGFFFQSCWPTRDHIGRPTRKFNPVMTSSAGGAKGLSDHRFRAPPAYTAQLLTLHQHRANNQYRKANQIQPTLRVSSSTQATLEQSPIQVQTELNVALLQWSYENWYFQVDNPLRPKMSIYTQYNPHFLQSSSLHKMYIFFVRGFFFS